MGLIKQRVEAAEALGIDERSLGRWKKEPGFPDCSAGYDIEAIRAWRDAGQRKGSETDQRIASLNNAIKLEKLNELKRKNHLLQIQIDEKNRTLVPVDVVHDVLMEVAGLHRGLMRMFQQKGDVAAAKMVETQVVDRLKKIVNDRLVRSGK